MARYTQDPPRRPNDPPNKTLGELQEISNTPKSKWPKLSAPDQYVVERMIRDRKKTTLGRKKKSGFITIGTLLILIGLGALIATVVGCTSYGHTHKYPDGSEDRTSYRDFFKKTDAANLATKVKVGTNGVYERSVGVDSFKTAGDVDTIKAATSGATEGAVKALMAK